MPELNDWFSEKKEKRTNHRYTKPTTDNYIPPGAKQVATFNKGNIYLIISILTTKIRKNY